MCKKEMCVKVQREDDRRDFREITDRITQEVNGIVSSTSIQVTGDANNPSNEDEAKGFIKGLRWVTRKNDFEEIR